MSDSTISPNVRVSELKAAWEEHPKNLLAFEWKDFPKDAHPIIYSAQKGKTFGNHFHTGNNPDKNPETLILVSGYLRFTTEDRLGKLNETLLDARDGRPKRVDTPPYIFHTATALEDSVFIEYETVGNSKASVGKDGDYHSREEFDQMPRSLDS